MRWPSEILSDFADKLDGWEDAALDRYVEATHRAKSLKVWEWRGQQERIEDLRNKNRLMVEEYEKLRVAYREKTGEEPPPSAMLVLADAEKYDKAMNLIRDALRKMVEGLRPIGDARRREGGGV